MPLSHANYTIHFGSLSGKKCSVPYTPEVVATINVGESGSDTPSLSVSWVPSLLDTSAPLVTSEGTGAGVCVCVCGRNRHESVSPHPEDFLSGGWQRRVKFPHCMLCQAAAWGGVRWGWGGC